MRLITKLVFLAALAFTVVPGRRSLVKAEHPPPAPVAIPLTLPKCAQPAQKKTLHNLGCAAQDPKCMCSKKEWLPLLLGAITHACDSKNRETAKQFGAAYCGLNPSTVVPAAPTITTFPGQPAVSYTCSPLDEEVQLTTTIHSTVHSTVVEGTRTSTETRKMMKTETAKTHAGKPTGGSTKGMIGTASRLETGMSTLALIGVVAAMGLTFAEF